ncbi:MAG: hsp20 [Candidatus Saccharibacteria bacterium]|jgi:HSP20 family protein|nr:hsp20 [Candidatus Saccharibacteria bacterium]
MANLIRFDPFAEMRALQKQFFNDDWFTALPNMHMPTTDVYVRDGKEMIVEAHLPRFNEGDVSVDVEGGVLEVQANHREKEEDKAKRYVVRESTNSFYRRIRLPDQADTKNIKASMEDGVLRVVVPLKKQPAPMKITVQPDSKKSKTSKEK